MSDENYWKDRYTHSWGKSAERERHVKQFLESTVPCKVDSGTGLGVESSEYITGSASSNDAERGGADLRIHSTNIFVEVTGPQVVVRRDQPLWVRPDKIESAKQHPDRDTWVVHCNHDNTVLRVIHIDKDFIDSFNRGAISVVTPEIRGTRERFAAIPAGSRYVQDVSVLIAAARDALSA